MRFFPHLFSAFFELFWIIDLKNQLITNKYYYNNTSIIFHRKHSLTFVIDIDETISNNV